MKIMVTGLILFFLAGCERTSVDEKEQALNCSLPGEIKISLETIKAVENEFQGRPFNRNSFWNVLTRETRTTLNLELKAQKNITEDLLYKAAVLFFENRLGKIAPVDENCEDKMKALEFINTDRLIFSTPDEEKLTCSFDSGAENVDLHLYKDHVIIWNGNERAVFVRAEIIRHDSLDIHLTAMDPEQRSLELRLSKTKVDLRFNGKTTMISGTGSCRN